MTTERFTFQRSCVAQTTGIVLNVGANEDPAGLKAIDPERVFNCDIEQVDSYLNRQNKVDFIFDARDTWPFEDNYAELVVLGDIIEHLYPEESFKVFREARRVSDRLCVTLPSDGRFEDDGYVEERNGYRTHCYKWTEKDIKKALVYCGWDVIFFQTVDYGFVPEGYFIAAERSLEFEENNHNFMPGRGITFSNVSGKPSESVSGLPGDSVLPTRDDS